MTHNYVAEFSISDFTVESSIFFLRLFYYFLLGDEL